ncbi:DUF7289 family protein [Halorubrum sp. DTA98]|uniref:DUF7289 family protein n=1 Tax=Halorubrum sp. DTA98 TaxID=3402163 RepID=UPI003AAA22BA
MFGASRGQSEVIGVVLLLGMTVLVVGSTVAIGSVALEDSQSAAELRKAEAAMTQVDSKASLVAHGDSTSQQVRLGTDGGVSVTDDGTMRIEIEFDDADDPEPIEANLNTVVYEHDGTTVAYQGGGVWRSDGERSEMVSPPEFHYRGETLTLPLVTVAGDGHVGENLLLTAAGEPERSFPTAESGNPLVGGNVTITVESEYHEAWGRFFEDRTDADVERLDGDRVEVSLPTRIDGSEVSDSVVGMNTRSTFVIGEVNRLFAESYDSSVGPPAESAHEGIQVHTVEDIDGTQTGQLEEIVIRGDLLTSGWLTPNRNAIDSAGDINVTGEIIEEATITPIRDLSAEIADRNAAFDEDSPSNPDAYDVSLTGDDTKTITGDAFVDGDATVDGGTLRLVANEETYVEIDGDLLINGTDGPAELVLDTNDGPDELHLMVRGDVDVTGGDAPANVTVEGDGKLFVYGDGDVRFDATDAPARMTVTDGDAHVQWFHDGSAITFDSGVTDGSAAEVVVENDRAAGRFWLVTAADDVRLAGGGEPASFNGVLYAANGGDGTVTVDGEATIDGALVADDSDLTNADLTLRHDQAIAETNDPFEGRQISTINHLHVSTQEVTVEENG